MPKGDSDTSDSNKVIISVTMQNDIKNRIDALVSEGVARSRTQMIEDAVRWYLDFTVYKWNERGIYINDVRVLFEPENIASLFFSSLRPNDQYEIGVTAGKQAPIADTMRLDHRCDPTDPKCRKLLIKLLQDSGWGSIRLQNDNILVISGPFYPPQFLRGYLESLMDCKIEIIETSVKENVALRIT